MSDQPELAPLSIPAQVFDPLADMRPTMLDVVRSAPPSEALVAFLTDASLTKQAEGQTALAADLLSLALCARSALRAGRPFA